MKFGRQVLLSTLLALLLLGQADAQCGPGGGMRGGPPPGGGWGCPTPGPGGGWAGALGSLFSGNSAPPAYNETANTRQVINLLNNYLRNQPNLKAGRLTVRGDYWEAEILDSQGNLVNRLLIDPRTGYFYYQK